MDLLTRLLLTGIVTAIFLHPSIGSSCTKTVRNLEHRLDFDLYYWNWKWGTELDHCDITEVYVTFDLKAFDLHSDDSLFTIYTWTTITWMDDRLKWTPSEYGNITEIIFTKQPAWIPQLRIQLNYKYDDLWTYTVEKGECKLYYYGSVICVPRIVDTVKCLTDMSDWPYDVQRCTLEYGVVKAQRKYVNLVARHEKVVFMPDAMVGGEWTIVGYEQKQNVSEESELSLTFVLKRNGEARGAIIILPAYLLAVLTISCLLLDVNDNNRFLMIMFVVLCHFVYLENLLWEIPIHGEDTPTVVLFFRFSLVFNMILVKLTMLLLKLQNRVTGPPLWIRKFSSIVLESHGKFFIWPRWVAAGYLRNSDSREAERWNDFTNIINSACLIITVFIYVIMLSVLIPKPT